MNSDIALSVFAGPAVVVVTGLIVLKYFRAELVEMVARLGRPSTKAIQKQSDELLEQMDRNVAARKAKRSS